MRRLSSRIHDLNRMGNPVEVSAGAQSWRVYDTVRGLHPGNTTPDVIQEGSAERRQLTISSSDKIERS
jgi:hypothetical protein